mmetsp:Transcript_19657/g.40399  ORF Transcript_19657/g.40399 Transcript_19657/m.40399 type:complete len:81 (-) Transcript_19657:1522-1764(-)
MPRRFIELTTRISSFPVSSTKTGKTICDFRHKQTSQRHTQVQDFVTSSGHNPDLECRQCPASRRQTIESQNKSKDFSFLP